MPLAAGTRLGTYVIAGPLGAGGMGEVYRARDTRLGRDVALKVLPDAFALDPDRVARFRREAQVLASLNHPHIAQIYGIEDADATRSSTSPSFALVMELVEGETLAERLAGGALPGREVLPIARQIAAALESAHEQGIVHRDLKPANIKLRADGTVKVLDFGLAKALDPAATLPLDAADSPTVTTPALTRMGVMLGTAAYMSPEQARGKIVDRRSDIWSFGCVLYEMLTGRPAFAGETVSDTVAAILDREPDWMRLPPSVPHGIRRLLRRLLEKDPKQRLHDIADARIEIDDVLNGAEGASIEPHGAARRRWLTAALVVCAAVAAAVGAFVQRNGRCSAAGIRP